MNRKKKPTEEVKMSTWEVFHRLVRDAPGPFTAGCCWAPCWVV